MTIAFKKVWTVLIFKEVDWLFLTTVWITLPFLLAFTAYLLPRITFWLPKTLWIEALI